MYKKLRIIFCCISVALVAAAIFVFVYAGIVWGIIDVLAAILSFIACKHFKDLQEKEQNRDEPKTPVGDFITGPEKKDDE